MAGAARRVRALLLAALLAGGTALAPAPVLAQRWLVNPAESRIGFTATWLGNPVQGSFRRWSAAIDFDPAKLAAARIAVDIDTRSAVTGDKTVDGALPDADWFAGTTARFVATSVTAAGPGRYAARGTLSLRGKQRPLVLDFTLVTSKTAGGDLATATATTTLDRRWFALGLESDATAQYVAFAVPVRIAITARKAR